MSNATFTPLEIRIYSSFGITPFPVHHGDISPLDCEIHGKFALMETITDYINGAKDYPVMYSIVRACGYLACYSKTRGFKRVTEKDFEKVVSYVDMDKNLLDLYSSYQQYFRTGKDTDKPVQGCDLENDGYVALITYGVQGANPDSVAYKVMQAIWSGVEKSAREKQRQEDFIPEKHGNAFTNELRGVNRYSFMDRYGDMVDRLTGIKTNDKEYLKVWIKTGSYELTAEQLGVTVPTVKAHIERIASFARTGKLTVQK